MTNDYYAAEYQRITIRGQDRKVEMILEGDSMFVTDTNIVPALLKITYPVIGVADDSPFYRVPFMGGSTFVKRGDLGMIIGRLADDHLIACGDAGLLSPEYVREHLGKDLTGVYT